MMVIVTKISYRDLEMTGVKVIWTGWMGLFQQPGGMPEGNGSFKL